MVNVVLTGCTNRKRATPASPLQARTLEAGAPEVVARAWADRLRGDVGPRLAVKDLYCGRSFREAERAAQAVDARLYVVSAGLGIVAQDAAAPSYSLTLAPESPDCVLRRAAGAPADWWSAIQAASPLHSDWPDEGGLILAALSRPYLEMVASDWAAWPGARLSRLRLFSKEPPSSLPVVLARQWMPYDDRLDQIDGFAGTQGDFAQRAMLHFVNVLAPKGECATADAEVITATLAPYSRLERPNRERRSDEAIIATILGEWDVVGGRSGEMLRHLRRQLGLACEQSRFKDLFKVAAAQRQERLL